MDEERKGRGMGWIPDYPDFRDYTEKTEEVKAVLKPTRALKVRSLSVSIDLREWCSPVEDQGEIGSCTAHAGAGVIEYYERKSFKRHIDASRLFLYKVTRNLMKMRGYGGLPSNNRGSHGALLIRNSWGKGWGEESYGWLPYEYILRGLAEDFWSVLKKEWIDTGQFRE